MDELPSNPADWQRFEAAADAPVTRQDAAASAEPDPVRTREVSEQLARMLFACVRAQRANAREAVPSNIATRFGLLGGLGQGKTSALHRAVARVNQMLVTETRRRPLNVAYFDAAKELPQDLEFEFDRLQASLSLGRLAGRAFWQLAAWFLLAAGCAFLIYLSLPSDYLPQSMPDWLKKALGPALLSLPPLVFVRNVKKFWDRRRERLFLFDRHEANAHPGMLGKISDAWAGLDSVIHPVDVLIVDNLDRASISQQRAVLRAVYKHQEDFHHALVVAFDESGLLRNTDHDPEAPEQLLSKAIQAVVRVPDRQPVEAILLARLAFHSLPQESWRQALNQTDIERAFAEVLLLVGNLSPRAAKRLLNDSCALLAQLPGTLRGDSGGQENATQQDVPLPQRARDWMPALFRLQGLWQIYPALHSQPQALCRVLECPDGVNLAALRQAVAEVKSDTRWERFLRDTTHLRPVNGEWANLVAMAGTQYWSTTATQATDTFSDGLYHSDYKLLDMLWQAVEAVTPMQDERGLRVLGEFLPITRRELDALGKVHLLRRADKALLPLVEEGQGAHELLKYLPVVSKELDGLKESLIPTTHEKTILPLLLCVLQIWSAVQLDRARAVMTLEIFLQVCAMEKDSWLQKADPAGTFRSALARLLIARASTAIPVNTGRLKQWLDWSANASAQWRMESILLSPAKYLTWFDLWLLLDTREVIGASKPASGSETAQSTCNPVELSCWVNSLAPMDVEEVRTHLAQLRDVVQKLAPSAREMLLLHWPALKDVGEDTAWAALSMYRCVCLAVSTSTWPQALYILWANQNFPPCALTAIFAMPGESSMDKWELGFAQKLLSARPDYYPNLDWQKLIEQAGEQDEVRAAIFLLLALTGVAELNSNRAFFDEAKSFWPTASSWALLVHDALLIACQKNQTGDAAEVWRNFAQTESELLAWLTSAVLGNVSAEKVLADGKPGLPMLLGMHTADKVPERKFADSGQDIKLLS